MTHVRGIPVSFGDAEFTVYHVIPPQISENDTEVSWYYHSHVYYEIHVITAGIAHFIYEDTQTSVETGEMIIIPPGSRHYACQISDCDCDKVLSVSLNRCEGETGYYDMFLSAFTKAAGYPCTLNKNLLKQIHHFCDIISQDGIRERCQLKVIAYEVILALLDTLNSFQVPKQQVREFRPKNEQNVALDVLINSDYSLSEIAGFLGYSPRHTTRLIHQRYGMRLGEIRQHRMLKAAKDLLRQVPDLPMSRVALQVGFPSADSMKRAFLKYEKVTPIAYREKTEKE